MENLTENKNGKETFTKEFTHCNPVNLIAKLLSYALINGIEKTEMLINNTFCGKEKQTIVLCINNITSTFITKGAL